MGILVFWGLYWGPPIYGNNHVAIIRQVRCLRALGLLVQNPNPPNRSPTQFLGTITFFQYGIHKVHKKLSQQ